MPMSTRLRPSSTRPLLMTTGVWRASMRACATRVRSEPAAGRGSCMTTQATTRCTTDRTADTQTATSRAEASSSPNTVAAGFHQMSRPESTAPTAIAPPRIDPARESGPVDVDTGGRRVHGVDEPRLERAGVQRPEGAHQGARDDERPEALRDRVGRDRDDVDDRGGEVDRAAAHGIREAARGQLEEEAGQAHDRADRGGLGDGQAAVGLHEDEDADDEAHRQPSGGRQQVEAALGRAGAEVRGAHRAGTFSRSSA